MMVVEWAKLGWIVRMRGMAAIIAIFAQMSINNCVYRFSIYTYFEERARDTLANSFMYEPILDMPGRRLRLLYLIVSKLS
jgi:hypothetical protein